MRQCVIMDNLDQILRDLRDELWGEEMSNRIKHDIEQGTPEWHKLRCAMLCSSEINDVITPKQRKISSSIDKLVFKKHATLISGEFEDFNVSFAAKRGKELEPYARAHYERITGRKVADGGFTSFGRLGASTDGIAEDRVLEIKCLMSENHYAAILDDNPENDFYFQTQTEMYVIGKPICDLFFFHPVMKNRLITIKYDNEMTKLFEQAEAAFIDKWQETVKKYAAIESSLIAAPIYN